MKHLPEIPVLLLEWYDRCARVMPWRGIHDPYRTWVSESMLQQTRVETVIPYYAHFLNRFPTLSDLASADESEVLKMWEGLGYYSRARNLLKGARQVMDQYHGVLPSDPEKLQKISGIGPYTAGAIASIAYNVPVPAVDGNVIRVFSRLFGIRENTGLPKVRKKLEHLAGSVVPQARPGDYNQAVMDLGATVCVPGTPDCARCPLSAVCDAFARGDAEDLPVIPRTRPPKIIRWTVPVILSGDRVLARRRTESLLHGLWSFPLLECDPSAVSAVINRKFHLPVVLERDALPARHVFTHLIWEMTVIPMKTDPDLPDPPDYRWLNLSELESVAFPSAMAVPLQEAFRMIQK